jgi:putrescine aminotransferase
VIEGEGPSTVAAFVGEPVSILQAVKVPHEGYWRRVREICDEYGVLLIADEVVTGFGRTGRMFGSEHWDMRPDILTLAKGVTSGYVPLAATVVSGSINEILSGTLLPHINTYAGHPVACAAALRNLDILEREGLVENAASLEEALLAGLRDLAASREEVFRVSVTGLLSSAEFFTDVGTAAQERLMAIRHHCYERGLILRAGAMDGIGAILFYPPLVVTEGEVRRSIESVSEVLEEIDWKSNQQA